MAYESYIAQAEAAIDGVIAEFRPKLLAASGQIAEEMKDNKTPVTELDLAMETALRAALDPIDGGVGFLGEEHGQSGSQETFWLIDPIDGTEQFIRGIPAYRTMLTLVGDDELQYTYVYNIAKGEKYVATRGKGAFCNGERLQVSSRPLARSWIELTVEQKSPMAAALLAPLRENTRGVRITGDFTHTLHGRLDGQFYGSWNDNAWDWTPWALLIKEAGGIVENIGKDGFDWHDSNFLAATPTNFAGLKEIIEKALANIQ